MTASLSVPHNPVHNIIMQHRKRSTGCIPELLSWSHCLMAVCRSPKITDITTLVMDLEGSDGRERGEDDTNFERQVGRDLGC